MLRTNTSRRLYSETITKAYVITFRYKATPRLDIPTHRRNPFATATRWNRRISRVRKRRASVTVNGQVEEVNRVYLIAPALSSNFHRSNGDVIQGGPFVTHYIFKIKRAPETRRPLPTMDNHITREVLNTLPAFLEKNRISGKGKGHRNSHSLDETQQRMLLPHVCISRGCEDTSSFEPAILVLPMSWLRHHLLEKPSFSNHR
ncbi:hypothetical protein EVAR_77266_1 [Eumeta japonica]|uniref:Uncharacterized protein n=1 Tax=Eumeta variegata TaxID=151549 RepID=A0A4C1UMN3_EUMVA|nr:hypothetical protein EVAR_77266_1 [Eumeta japonica]